jgi:methyl-accepting chemotaxis protein
MNFFDDAVTAHIAWKGRLRRLVDGEGPLPDPAVVADDHRCELGRWIFGQGHVYAGLPAYGELCDVHARFHRCAAAVVDAIAHGDMDRADSMIQPDADFAETSAETVIAIGALRVQIENQQHPDEDA